MFPTKPLGEGKLGIPPIKVGDIERRESEDFEIFIQPFERDLSGVCLDSDLTFSFQGSDHKSALEAYWIKQGVPEEDIEAWRVQATLGYFLTCIKNPLSCEPKSLIFWCGQSIKVGFDRRDDVNIFFLAWRDHLVIDLDDCQHAHDDAHDHDVFQARCRILTEIANERDLTFGLYRTDRGFHAIELSRSWDASELEPLEMTRKVGGDIKYAAISCMQGWRLRLSPKSRTPTDFVVEPPLTTIGRAAVSPLTTQTMQAYTELASVITQRLRDFPNLPSTVESLWSSPKLMTTFSKLINRTLKQYPVLYEQKITSRPFKSSEALISNLISESTIK